MKNYCVYCHTNKINEKKYIGITSQKPERRWRNGNGYRNNEYFFRAIEKYGWHNFRHEILYTDLSKKDAERIEVELIAEYKTQENQNGYNIESGGNSTGRIPQTTRQKISEALKGHPCSIETRKKISESKVGKPSPNKGTKMTEEQIRINSESHKGQIPWNKGRPWTAEEKAKCGGKQVRCVETGKVYRTIHEANKDTGANIGRICACCKGKAKTTGGYHWEYLQVTAEETILTEEVSNG